MLLLLGLLAPHSLTTCPTANCGGLYRAAPPLIPKPLLLRGPNALCTAIAACELDILVVERWRVRIVGCLLAEIGLDAMTASDFLWSFSLHDARCTLAG
jgi:hypothetical protein